jgi:hypothetical protein
MFDPLDSADPLPSDPRDPQDAAFERNLRAIAGHLPLPESTGEADLRHWKGERGSVRLTHDPAPAGAGGFEAQPTRRGAQGDRSMHFRRILKFAGAGSAIAAVLALAFVLLGPTGTRRVDASAIFDSLEQALTHAFRLSFENLGEDGLLARGHIVALHTGPADGEDTAATPALVQLELHFQGAEGAADYAGLNVDLHAALTPDSQWAYLRSAGLPQSVIDGNPALGVIQQASSNGLLVDFTGLAQSMADDGDDDGEDAGGEEAGEEAAGGDGSVSTTLVFSNTPPPEAPDHPGVSFDFHFGAHTASDGDEAAGDEDQDPADPQQVQVQAQTVIDVRTEDGSSVGALIRDVLKRQATPEQLQQLIDLIEASAGEVDVEPQADGSHLLTAADFDFDAADGEEDAWLADMVLKILYVENDGVRWAELEHVGVYGGRVQLDLVAVALDPQMNKEQFIEPGVTTVWDMSSLGSMMQLFSGAGL